MTDKFDDDAATDSLLRSIYLDVAREHTPDRLDKAVLEVAGRSAAVNRSRLRSWISPLALAASISLCLAIVLQVTGVPDSGSQRSVQPASSPEAVHEAAIESREQKMGEDYRAKSATVQDARSDVAAEVSGPGLAPAARIEAAGYDARDAAGPCADAELAGPDTWWECIESLEAGGNAALATTERSRLEQAHPGFTPSRD